MKVIIYTNESGGVSVVTPTGDLPLEVVAQKDTPDNADYEIIDDSELPSDRFFRNAWVKEGKKVKEDLKKSKEIAHNQRRQKRAEEFTPYDEVIMKQIPGNDMKNAETERQKIRDKYEKIQQDIESAKSPEELKSIMASMV